MRLWTLRVLGLLVFAVWAGSATAERIVAIGDLHGDIAATRGALRLAGAIDDEDRWIGGELVLVQTGDQLDRGDDEQQILDLFDRLRVEARAAGGAFHALLGNHELMNAKGDLRYVTDGGYADFEDAVSFDADDPELAAFEPHQRARMAALLPGRPYAMRLAERSLILQLGQNVFVHGGVRPEHIEYGIERINQETRAWLRGEIERPDILNGSGSPQWTRLYSDEADSSACSTLAEVLRRLGATRLVVGHTIQEGGIADACDGMVWCIDVAMAKHFGGTEIAGDEIRVLQP
jgi:hypothetical protein